MNTVTTTRRNQLRNSQVIPANIKNALRSLRRQDNKESILVTGPNDPKPVKRDICITKVVQSGIGATATTNYSYSGIYKLLDNGATPFFTDIRVISCSVYGPTGDSPVTANVLADGASFSDAGVLGSRRPVLHIRFPEVVRINWQPTNSTINVLSIPATPLPVTGSAGVVQFTIEVRGDATAT